MRPGSWSKQAGWVSSSVVIGTLSQVYDKLEFLNVMGPSPTKPGLSSKIRDIKLFQINMLWVDVKAMINTKLRLPANPNFTTTD
jgi:hypothetical protein